MACRVLLLLAGAVGCALGQAESAGAAAPVTAAVQASGPAAAVGGVIRGTVKAGTVPLPGVSVTATNTLTGKKYATTTDVTGAFAMAIPRNGRYVVKAELAAFASETQEVLINAAGLNGGKAEQVAEFGMQLASRVEAEQEQQTARQAGAVSGLASALGRGMQSLNVTGGEADLADASAGGGNAGVQMPTLSGLGGDNVATDSVAVSGQMGQTNGLAGFNEDEIRQRVQDAIAQAQRQGGAQGDIANAVVGMLGGMMGGGGFGGPGGPRGGGGRGGGFRGFNPTQPHGAVFYQGGNGALNATNFSLTGVPIEKPSYSSNRFGVSFTGSPSIPGLLKASTKQFIFFNVTGQRNINPLNLYGTVPTIAERSGDFSQVTKPIYDPTTGQTFAANVIPTGRISAQAQALLAYYPAPNIAVVGPQAYNYQTITTAGSNATSAALRYVRNFGQGGFGGFGGRRQAANAPKTLRQNINFNGSYSHAASDNRNLFLPLGGTTASDGYGVTAGYTVGYGRLTNNASVNWNRSHSMVQNYFTNSVTNPAAVAGVSIPSQTAGLANPNFYNGVPNLTFTGYSGISEVTPRDGINQTISFSDFLSWGHKKHNMRFGIDVRRVHADSLGGNNVVGTFIFSGYATQSPTEQQAATTTSTRLAATGSGFADYLLGLPQQTKIQAGLAKIYLRANVYDWYAQDDWRALPNVTFNFGLRYEYFSPYVEKNNRLVNLDHNADFTQVAPVMPGGTGSFQGSYPRSLVNPDRTMYSPRLGVAWRPKFLKETVIRGGYGINFNTGQFATFAQSLAYQPPYAVTQTNVLNTVTSSTGCTMANMTLTNGFGCSTKTVQNNYAVNKNYQLGDVQVWNIDIQKTLPMGIVTNIGYNGSLGGNLDMLRAPNHTATSVTTSDAQAFTYEDSVGFSRLNMLAVNVRKRMQKGVALQATYQYGHSIDNASSIGGAAQVTAQNDQRLDLEEGNSAFDIRHKLTGNWVLELPFGPNRAFLAKGGFWSKALDGFSISGDYTFGTGRYYSPVYDSTSAQISAGGTYSLRPDRVFGQPIKGPGTQGLWFNKAAFTSPANGFGTASRNSIEGPGTVAVDMSLAKTVSFGETRSFEARLTAANALNTVQYSGIDTTVNSPTFGQVTSAAPMRQITLLARYRF
jgi:hypothetical protein